MLDDRRHTGLASGWRKLSVLECNPPLSLCQPGHHDGDFSHGDHDGENSHGDIDDAENYGNWVTGTKS